VGGVVSSIGILGSERVGVGVSYGGKSRKECFVRVGKSVLDGWEWVEL